MRLFRYGLRDTDRCVRCNATGADFLHVAWLCPAVEKFWRHIFQLLTDITGLLIAPDPLLALLGYTKPLRKGVRKLVAMGLLLAKRRIAIRWMRGPAPTIAEWDRDMLFCNTQSDRHNEFLLPSNRPTSFWGLYTQYNLARQNTEDDQD